VFELISSGVEADVLAEKVDQIVLGKIPGVHVLARQRVDDEFLEVLGRGLLTQERTFHELPSSAVTPFHCNSYSCA